MIPKLISVKLPKDRRIIVVSDMHGNLPYFKGILEKVGFSSDDVLIINGDFLEKGEQSLETLHFVMQLYAQGNTYVLRGNCDGWHQIIYHPEIEAYTLRYMLPRPNCLLRQMCRAGGLEVTADTDIEDVKQLLREKFTPEMEFLAQRPIIMETEHYIFVHGGISEPNIHEANPYKCMKNDDFLGQGLAFDKWQIVGHWPVVLYGEGITDANPIILRDRKIASIDGGCALKDDGQLNALIIPYDGSEDFICTYYDHFPTATALDAQSSSESSYYIRWGDNKVQVLSDDGEFARCRHVRTGYEMDIPSSFLCRSDDGVTTNDCSDYLLPVAPGDELSIVRETSRGYLCKKNGVSGWYRGKIEYKKDN